MPPSRRPAAVDLRADQTTIKSQGSRRSCITFSSTAALEAAYKRAGYGELNLSEEFFQYMNKTFWLHAWDSQRGKRASDQETQLGFSAGGAGSDYLGPASNGFRIPEESVWPYKSTDYSSSDHPAIANRYDSSYWSEQKTKSDFNLEGGFLQKSHLTASRYFSGTGFARIGTGDKGAMIRAIENQLAARRDVVIDLNMRYRVDYNDALGMRLLERCDACSNRGGHSMLIVGYDRTSLDRRDHHFIVKNSWGADHGTTGPDGFTYVSYDMLKKNAYAASYITGVERPAPWPELANVGRWETNFDGWRGTLDIYHVPGFMDQPFADRGIDMRDTRIGTFYDHAGRAYRVNGEMNGRALTFWIDRNMPHTPYDRLRGTRYVMNRLHGEDLIVGRYTDPAGNTYAGYLERKGAVAFVEPPVRYGIVPRDMVGRWSMTYGTATARTVEFCISSAGYHGTLGGQGSFRITGAVHAGEGGRRFRLRGVVSDYGYIDAYRMSWHSDIATGSSYWDSGRSRGGVIMRKLSGRCV